MAVTAKLVDKLIRVPYIGEITGTDSVTIYGCKRQTVSFQIGIATGSGTITGVEFTAELTKGSDTLEDVTWYRQQGVTTARTSRYGGLGPGTFHDALIPFVDPYDSGAVAGGTYEPLGFATTENNAAFWCDVAIPVDAEPGMYSGVVTVTNGDTDTDTVAVSVRVWDYAIPKRPRLDSYFGTSWTYLDDYFTYTGIDETYIALNRRHMLLAFDNRVTLYPPQFYMPVPDTETKLPTDTGYESEIETLVGDYWAWRHSVPRADYYWPLRLTTQEHLNIYYAALVTYWNNLGLEEIYCYAVDEPNDADGYATVVTEAAKIHTATDQIKVLVTEQVFKENSEWTDITDSVDIWCPLINNVYESGQDARISAGDELWLYTASALYALPTHPDYAEINTTPTVYWQLDRPLENFRVMPWMCHRYNATGLLYYALMTNDGADPIAANVASWSENLAGDTLAYPGETFFNIVGCIPSIRLKMVRDGMYDYDLLLAYEEAFGESAAATLRADLVTDNHTWSTTSTDYEAAWQTLGNSLVANKYWVAAEAGNASAAANWALTAGGEGGVGVSAGDTAIFTGDSTQNCTFDASISLTAVEEQAAYSGNVTIASGVTVSLADGENYAKGGSGQLAGPGTISVTNGDVVRTAGQTAATRPTVQFNGTCTTALKATLLSNVNVPAGSTLTVGNEGFVNFITNAGTVTVATGHYFSCYGYTSTASTAALSGAGIAQVLLNQTGSTFTRASGDTVNVTTLRLVYAGATVTVNGGVFGCTTLELGTASTIDAEFVLDGTYDVTGKLLIKNAGSGTLTISNDENNPSFNCNTLEVVNSGGGTLTYDKGTGTITVDGTGNVTFTQAGVDLERVLCSKTSGTATLAGAFAGASLRVDTGGTLNTNGQTIDCGTGSFECYYPATLAKAGLPDTAITCGDFGLVGNLASFTDYGAASAWTLAKSGTGRIRHCTVAYLDASGSTGADVDAYSCTDGSDNSENIDFTTAPAQQPIAQAFAIAGLHV